MQKVRNVFLFLFLSVSLAAANVPALAYCGDCDCRECDCCEDCGCEDCCDCREDCRECDGDYYAYRQGRGSGKADLKRWDSCDDMQEYIPEGATIRVEGGVDVYIVKYKNGKMFKRLVLNPQVFENYGHLRWEDVMNVSPDVLDAYATSDLVRSDHSGKVYKLYPSGDKGTKRMVAYHGDYWYCIDWDSVYTINGFDEDSYATSSTIY